MGQQQLLLLTLGIVLVGLAVVVGISAFQENDRKSRIDRYQLRAVELTADAMAWKMKPAALGGGGAGYVPAHIPTNSDGHTPPQSPFDGIQLTTLGREQDAFNGKASWKTTADLQVILHSYSENGLAAEMVELPKRNGSVKVEAFAYGLSSECIVTRTGVFTEGQGYSYIDSPSYPTAPAGCSW